MVLVESIVHTASQGIGYGSARRGRLVGSTMMSEQDCAEAEIQTIITGSKRTQKELRGRTDAQRKVIAVVAPIHPHATLGLPDHSGDRFRAG